MKNKWMVIWLLAALLVVLLIYRGFSPVTDQKTFTNSIGMEFVLIPAGEFDMSEGPAHRVKIAKAFYMGRYEVTQKQWREIIGNNPSYFNGDNLPVERVSWNGVQKFIKKLNEKEDTNKYRLPSEAEWEYAARAGTTTGYSFGDDESKLGDYAWYDANSGGKNHEVGTKKPNPWGLYDMHGNVWEWVQDIYHNSYDGAPADGSAWEGDGYYRVMRGGSAGDFAGILRSSSLGADDAGFRSGGLGFRLVRDISQNGQKDPLERMKTPIWTVNDLEIVKYKDEMFSIYKTTFLEQPPFYSGPMPIEIKIAKRVIIPGSYGSTEIAVIGLHDFGDFKNLFIYEEKGYLRFWLVGARTYTYDSSKPVLVAEAKINYSINQEKRVIELEEFHYGQDGKLEFYSKSEIDPSMGFKIKETEKMGRKHRDYYFILPIGPMWT